MQNVITEFRPALSRIRRTGDFRSNPGRKELPRWPSLSSAYWIPAEALSSSRPRVSPSPHPWPRPKRTPRPPHRPSPTPPPDPSPSTSSPSSKTNPTVGARGAGQRPTATPISIHSWHTSSPPPMVSSPKISTACPTGRRTTATTSKPKSRRKTSKPIASETAPSTAE